MILTANYLMQKGYLYLMVAIPITVIGSFFMIITMPPTSTIKTMCTSQESSMLTSLMISRADKDSINPQTLIVTISDQQLARSPELSYRINGADAAYQTMVDKCKNSIGGSGFPVSTLCEGIYYASIDKCEEKKLMEELGLDRSLVGSWRLHGLIALINGHRYSIGI
jgi:hypothetical protein